MNTTLRKRHGIVYTPEPIVEIILDNVLPVSSSELSRSVICDPACGDGAFLVSVARRVLTQLNHNEAMRVLSQMVGFDIDRDAIEKCKSNLNNILNIFYPNESIDWNIYEHNVIQRSLFDPGNQYGRFTHVVGNPPYVRVQNLEQHGRDQISQGWNVLRGATDLYIVFYELALDLLRPNGILGFITPSSWTRSDSGSLLRNQLVRSHNVKKLIDFGDHQVFKDVTTYSLIAIIQKGGTTSSIPVETFDGLTLSKGSSVVLDREDLSKPWWIASSASDNIRMNELHRQGIPLGEAADIHVGIQTLADSVFILTQEEAKFLRFEPWLMKPIVKASVMKNGEDPVKRTVIFPYDDNGILLQEEQICDEAPNIYEWLHSNKQRLLNRDKGKIKPDKWYGFGRKVSIVSGFGPKILTSGMNRTPNFQICPDPNATFYSGYCIKPKYPISFELLLESLNSDDMEFFIRRVSRPYQGGWMSYAKSFIKNFPVPADCFIEKGL